MSRATQNTAHFRVTSIQHKHGNFVVFSGVPIHKDTYKVTSARYIVTVITKLSDLPCEPSAGQHWTVNGEKKVTTQSRDNYQYEQHCYEQPRDVLCTLPETGEQLIRFISKERDFRGIGECKARALWQVLGDDFYETLRNDTPKHRETLREILTEDSINALFKGFVKYKNLDAANWLSKIKIPSQIQQRLFRFHQKKTLNLIKENPFTLLKFGMSFNDIDVIAKSYFAVTDNDPRRLSAAVESAINKEVAKGHTYAKHEHLLPHVCRTLKCKDLTSKALRTGIENNQFALNNDTGTYHPVSQLLMESVIAKRFIKLLRNNNRFDEHANIAFIKAKSDLPYPLLDKQSEAVITSLDNSISAITGGAGTGKTTVLRTVLKAFNELHYDIHAVALSGRAAMRLHESIGFNTSTIAAFLRQPAVEPFLTQRLHVLVIDEASMIDTPTMYRLITHIHPSVRIILTGDPDQLPPIGPGKVLADLVSSSVIANTRLDIVKRQNGSTGIPEYSASVNNGIVPKELNTKSITFHESSKKDIAKKCADLLMLNPEASRIVGSTRAIVSDINKLCQLQSNPDGTPLQFVLDGENMYRNLRLNDAIIFTQNNYDKGIQNGSLGTLTSVTRTQNSYGIVTLDTNETVEISEAVLDCMELGYCVTLHKAQGSQFPRVIIALVPGRIVDRAWLYTAITRAESEIHLVGCAKDFKQIIEVPSQTDKRRTYLSELLIQASEATIGRH